MMKWIVIFLFMFSSCAPLSWQGKRNPSSSSEIQICTKSIDTFAEFLALTPFEKRSQVLFQEMLDKKSKITYEELTRLKNQAELFELLESLNLKYGLPEIDFAAWIKDHREKDLKTILKIFKKFETDKNISTRDVEVMTLKLYRLLNGYRPIYKKIPFYTHLKEMLQNSYDEKILEAIRTKIWMEGLNDHVKALGRYKNASTLQKVFNAKRVWNNQIKISFATILEVAQYSFIGELTPIYVPGLKLFDYKKITNEILESIEKNGLKNTKTILEKNFQKTLALERYYNILTYLYNRTYWMYLTSVTSIVVYDYYQEQKAKKEEMLKTQSDIEELIGGLGNIEELLVLKGPEEQADDFVKTLREAGLSDGEAEAFRQKYIDTGEKIQNETKE